jgi:hypothetical protein
LPSPGAKRGTAAPGSGRKGIGGGLTSGGKNGRVSERVLSTGTASFGEGPENTGMGTDGRLATTGPGGIGGEPENESTCGGIELYVWNDGGTGGIAASLGGDSTGTSGT